MITRFDHAVIAVPDIPRALEAFTRLGFDVAAGGRHPSLGTQNAIIRFGLDYIELLAVEDRAQAHARGPFGGELADYLSRTSGLIGFVLASSDLDEEAAGLKRIGLDSEGPFAMDRERPDGRQLAWRLVIPGSSPWRKPWPFLIEWQTPDAERISWDPIGAHQNGAIGVVGLELIVDDLMAARRLYEDAFGLNPSSSCDTGVVYQLGAFCLEVHVPNDDEETAEMGKDGPGAFRLLLKSHKSGVAPLDLNRDAAMGARIRLTE